MRPVRLSMPAERGRVPALVLSAALSGMLLAGCAGSNDTPAASATSGGASAGTAAPSAATSPNDSAAASPSAGDSAVPAPSDSGSPRTSTPAGTGPNGVEKLAAAQILEKAQEAGGAAASVHVKGEVKQGAQGVGLDVRTKNTAGTGKVRSGAQNFEIRLVDSAVYVRGDKSFYTQFGQQSKLLEGKWLKASKSNRSFAKLTAFFNIRQLLATVLKPGEKLDKASTTTIDGRKAIALQDGKGATLYVAMEGQPYPLRVEAGPREKSSGRLDFTGWNDEVKVDAPPADSVFDVDALQRG